MRLRLDPRSEAFTEVWGAHVKVLLPAGSASQGAFVEVEGAGFVWRGLVAPRELELGILRSTLFGGYVWSLGPEALSWTSATQGRVELELDPGPRVRPVGALPRRERSCEQLTVESEAAIAEPSVSSVRGLAWEAEWVGGERVPLSFSPAGAPVAFLDTRPETPDAELEEALVIERRGGAYRVLYWLEHALVMGWVPESALRTGERVEPELVSLEAPGVARSPLAPFGRDDPTRYGELEAGARRCVWNAPVAVELEGVTREVGTMASGIPLRLGVEQGGFREVSFDHPYLDVNPLARFWVPEWMLYPCPVRDGSSEG